MYNISILKVSEDHRIQRAKMIWLLSSFCESDSKVTKVEHGVVWPHEYVSKNPACTLCQLSLSHSNRNLKKDAECMNGKVFIGYHRGPVGGARSSAPNPLIQIAAMPSPVFRIYWKNMANGTSNYSPKQLT